MTLAYGSMLCDGVMSYVNPTRTMHLCIDCERRLSKPVHTWQKYMEPAPAAHDGQKWVCEKRVVT